MAFNARAFLENLKAQGAPAKAANAAKAERENPERPETLAGLAALAGANPGTEKPRAATWSDDDTIAERVAIIEHDAGIPRAWAEGLARLATMPAPEAWGLDWREVRDGVLRFADGLGSGPWAAKAFAGGWNTVDLFGVDPAAPYARLDVRGAATYLKAARVVAITAEEIVIEIRPGNRLCVTKPTNKGGVAVWKI